jgi:hypothetical protein
MQSAGAHFLASLVSFHTGVEHGQLFVLAMIPALELLLRRAAAKGKGTIILSAIVALAAWHGMNDCCHALSPYPIRWPSLKAGSLKKSLQFLMLIVFGAALV